MVLPADLLQAAADAEGGGIPSGDTVSVAAAPAEGGAGGSGGEGASGSGTTSGSDSGTARTAEAGTRLEPPEVTDTAAAAAAATLEEIPPVPELVSVTASALAAAGRSLTEAEHKALMPSLLRLRQACCHPQVCVWGGEGVGLPEALTLYPKA